MGRILKLYKSFFEKSRTKFQITFDLNILGTFLLSKHFKMVDLKVDMVVAAVVGCRIALVVIQILLEYLTV